MPGGAPKGRRCTICQHPQRPNIDLAIATGVSRRLIAARFKVSADAAWRHGRAHLTPEIRAALATKVLAREGDMHRILLEEGTGVVEALKAIRGPLFGMFLAAVDLGDTKAATALSGRLHESLSLTAKLTGELVPHTGVSITNVLLSSDFMRLRAELLRVLARYPEAREEVAAVFRQAGLQAATAEIDRGAAGACRLTSCSILRTGSTRRCSPKTASGFAPIPGNRRCCARGPGGSY
jgi:hypothetical protein